MNSSEAQIQIDPLTGAQYFSDPSGGVARLVLDPGSHFHITTDSLWVSARTVEEMQRMGRVPPDFQPNPNLAYGIVGAGMDDLAPSIVDILGDKLQIPPTVIDPFPYDTGARLLRKALESCQLDKHHEAAIARALYNVSVVTDPTKVRLINITLEKAMETMPDELAAAFDGVFDCSGARVYSPEPADVVFWENEYMLAPEARQVNVID